MCAAHDGLPAWTKWTRAVVWSGCGRSGNSGARLPHRRAKRQQSTQRPAALETGTGDPAERHQLGHCLGGCRPGVVRRPHLRGWSKRAQSEPSPRALRCHLRQRSGHERSRAFSLSRRDLAGRECLSACSRAVLEFIYPCWLRRRWHFLLSQQRRPVAGVPI